MWPHAELGAPFSKAMAPRETNSLHLSLVAGNTPHRLEDIEPYCHACFDTILHWQWKRNSTKQLHSSVADLVACGKTCRLCRYICSLYETLNLEGIWGHAQSVQSVWITRESQESWVTVQRILKTVVITVDIRSPILWAHSLGQRMLTVVTDAGRFENLCFLTSKRLTVRLVSHRSFSHTRYLVYKSCGIPWAQLYYP